MSDHIRINLRFIADEDPDLYAKLLALTVSSRARFIRALIRKGFYGINTAEGMRPVPAIAQEKGGIIVKDKLTDGKKPAMKGMIPMDFSEMEIYGGARNG